MLYTPVSYLNFIFLPHTDRLAKLPSAELVLDKGFDVLLLTEDVDEFCLQILHSYPRKDAEGKDSTVEFKNVNSGDLGLESEEEKKAAEDATRPTRHAPRRLARRPWQRRTRSRGRS